jgi:hypothetical protein
LRPSSGTVEVEVLGGLVDYAQAGLTMTQDIPQLYGQLLTATVDCPVDELDCRFDLAGPIGPEASE